MSSVAKRMFAVHSAVGVAAGLVLFAVMLTGTVALFQEEVVAWSNPTLRFSAPDHVDVDGLLARHAERIPRDADDIFLFLPTPYRPSLRVDVHDHGESEVMDIDPRTGAILPTGQHGFEWVWRRVHTNALMGGVGRYLVGLAGLVMLMALGTGLLAHRKMFQQLMTWRRDKSFRVRTGDLHKLLGVWGSAAHLLFGFTGAIIGLVGILALVSAIVVYDGDRDAAIQAVVGPPVKRAGEPAPVPRLRPLFEQAGAIDPTVDWNLARLMHWGDANVHVELAGFARNAIAMRRSARFRGHDGAVTHEVDWWGGGPWHRAFGMVQPLHYADFGGPWVKLLYTALGLAGTLLIATGLIVWLDGRTRREAGMRASQRALSGLTAGVLGGFTLATFALPVVDRMWAADTDDRLGTVVAAYVTLLGASLLYAMLQPPRRALQTLLLASAVSAVGAAVMDLIATGWTGAFVDSVPVAVTNASFLATGALLAWTALKLPREVLSLPQPSRSPLVWSSPRTPADRDGQLSAGQ